MGTWGGSQKNAGRKRGSRTLRSGKNSQKAREILEDGGSTPLDVLLRAMRWFEQQAEDETEIYEKLLAEDPHKTKDVTQQALNAVRASTRDAANYAKDAAPFCHPKLSTMEVKSDPKAPIGRILVELVPAGKAARK